MSESVKITVSGAAGRMGRRLVALAGSSGEMEVVGALERVDHPDIGRDAGGVAGIGEIGVLLTSEPSEALAGADVLVDFAAPPAHPAWRAAAEAGAGIVLGTTALSEKERAILNEVSSIVPVLDAPNMSLGVNLLFDLAPRVARSLGPSYDIEIIEAHHNRKKDAPSGTAAMLLKGLLEARSWSPEAVVPGRMGNVGERGEEIGVHAVRAGDIVGEHTILFATEGERIELTHRASSRDTFALGALRAAAFLKGRPAGEYGMREVLGLE